MKNTSKKAKTASFKLNKAVKVGDFFRFWSERNR